MKWIETTDKNKVLDMNTQKKYLVRWEIDQDAENPKTAAYAIYNGFFREKGFGEALYFDVIDPDTGDKIGFDLSKADKLREEKGVCRGDKRRCFEVDWPCRSGWRIKRR